MLAQTDGSRKYVLSAPMGARLLLQAHLIGNGELVAALFSTTGNQFAAVLGRHAATEAVLVFTCAAGRLIGTFHRYSKRNYVRYEKLERKGRTLLSKTNWGAKKRPKWVHLILETDRPHERTGIVGQRGFFKMQPIGLLEGGFSHPARGVGTETRPSERFQPQVRTKIQFF